MDMIPEHGGEQAKLWNGAAGRNWVEAQSLLDRLFQPIEDMLVEAAAANGASRVLDVGCGTGSVTLAAARRLGDCTGIDISEPMIAAARTRAKREGLGANFIRADAQSYGFEPRSFDMMISRFGVMFFADPVQAFANLRSAAADRAELRFVAWRRAEENAFMTAAERAAAPLLPNLPARRPEEPGQFAFADRDRVGRILHESGWKEIEVRPADIPCTLPEPELVPYLSKLGPVGRALEGVDERTRLRIVEPIRAAFEPYVRGSEVRFTAGCWVASARACSNNPGAP